MVKINYSDPQLQFDHVVIFEKDNTVFAAARYNGNNSLRIFLVYEDTGNVYTRNGRAESWEQLLECEATTIRNRISDARTSGIQTFRINGSTSLTTGGCHQ